MSAIGPRKRKALIRDLAAGKFDVCTLADDHNLPEEAVAAFMAEPETRKMMAHVFVAADYQAQLVLSRCRTLAAGRLVDLAAGGSREKVDSGEEKGEGRSGSAPGAGLRGPGAGGVPAEVARKACLDLLKTELPRTAGDLTPPAPEPTDAEDAEQFQELRDVLYEKEGSS